MVVLEDIIVTLESGIHPATYTTDTFNLGAAGKLLSLESEIIPINSLKRLQSRPYSFAVTGFQFQIGEVWHKEGACLTGGA